MVNSIFEPIPTQSFNIDDLTVNLSPETIDYAKFLITGKETTLDPNDRKDLILEKQKKITESIFTIFQKFLWQYVRNNEFAILGSKKIFKNKYLVIQHLPSGTALYIKTHKPFTLRYEARAIRVLDSTILNYRDSDMNLTDLKTTDNIVCNWFNDLINAYAIHIKGIENDKNNKDADLLPYAHLWLKILKETLKYATHTLSRLDLNLNILSDTKLKHKGLRDITVYDLLDRWLDMVSKYDTANNLFTGVRRTIRNSYYLQPRFKNRVHLSAYDKNADTLSKLEGSDQGSNDRVGIKKTIEHNENEIESIKRKLLEIKSKVRKKDSEALQYQKRLYGKLSYLTNKVIPVLKQQKEQLEIELKDNKPKIYRVELRFFKDAIYRAIKKATNDELKTADINQICQLDKDILKDVYYEALKEICDNYDPLRYTYRVSNDTQEIKDYYKDISNGFSITPLEILKYIANNGNETTIQELDEHGFTYQANKYIKSVQSFYTDADKEPYEPLADDKIISISYDKNIGKIKIERETKDLIGTQERQVSKSTISDKVKTLKQYGMVTRCNGHVSITDEGLHFLGKGRESKTLVYRLFVLGYILDNNNGNTKKDGIQSFANSTSDINRNTLYFQFLQDDPPPQPPKDGITNG